MSDLEQVKPKARPAPAPANVQWLKNPEGRIFEATPELLHAARKHHLTPCDGPAEEKPPVDTEREELIAQHVEKFGKKPHKLTSNETIRKALEEGNE